MPSEINTRASLLQVTNQRGTCLLTLVDIPARGCPVSVTRALSYSTWRLGRTSGRSLPITAVFLPGRGDFLPHTPDGRVRRLRRFGRGRPPFLSSVTSFATIRTGRHTPSLPLNSALSHRPREFMRLTPRLYHASGSRHALAPILLME